ncbi:hypothetical protein DAI22_04g276200 [Oryza sativa Japonica Group]|nr:hypothetical protein DAI22_04g276200 [Oryza sativa Japonica Group]
MVRFLNSNAWSCTVAPGRPLTGTARWGSPPLAPAAAPSSTQPCRLLPPLHVSHQTCTSNYNQQHHGLLVEMITSSIYIISVIPSS